MNDRCVNLKTLEFDKKTPSSLTPDSIPLLITSASLWTMFKFWKSKVRMLILHLAFLSWNFNQNQQLKRPKQEAINWKKKIFFLLEAHKINSLFRMEIWDFFSVIIKRNMIYWVAGPAQKTQKPSSFSQQKRRDETGIVFNYQYKR